MPVLARSRTGRQYAYSFTLITLCRTKKVLKFTYRRPKRTTEAAKRKHYSGFSWLIRRNSWLSQFSYLILSKNVKICIRCSTVLPPSPPSSAVALAKAGFALKAVSAVSGFITRTASADKVRWSFFKPSLHLLN